MSILIDWENYKSNQVWRAKTWQPCCATLSQATQDGVGRV